MKDKNPAAVALGKKSAEKRMEGKTPEEISEFYRNLRTQRKDLQANQA